MLASAQVNIALPVSFSTAACIAEGMFSLASTIAVFPQGSDHCLAHWGP